MQHHVEEFSVSDLRHTLAEGWRILRERRWWLIIPGCLVASAALFASHWVPRKYTSVSIIERRNDPILAGILGSRWTAAYDEQRRSFANDIRERSAVLAILEELDLPQGLQHQDDGRLTPASVARRESFADQVISGIASRTLESTTHRDVIEVALSLDDPAFAPALTNRLRDTYIQRTRRNTVAVLLDARSFFEREAARSASSLKELERRLAEYEVNYPGINRDQVDTSLSRMDRLLTDRALHVKQLQTLRRTRDTAAAEAAGMDSAGGEAPAHQSDTPPRSLKPNPRYVELQEQIAKLEEDIKQGKTQRFMTDQHPFVTGCRTRIEQLSHELAELSPTIEDGAGFAEGLSRRQQLEAQIVEMDAKITLEQGAVDHVDEQLQDLRLRKAQSIEHRPDYEKIKAEAETIRSELEGWRSQIGPINHVLTVENKNRGIHFAIMSEAAPIHKPSYPDAWLLLSICGGMGIAVGAICVVIRELADRSFRNAKQLTNSLGIPVIESIDEIITAAARRRRLIRGLIMMPALSLALGGILAGAGALAYLSLERPADYHRIKTWPARNLTSWETSQLSSAPGSGEQPPITAARPSALPAVDAIQEADAGPNAAHRPPAEAQPLPVAARTEGRAERDSPAARPG